jgi:hypothetical protein
MKKTLIFALAAMLFMISCRKSDNPKLEGVERVPLPQLTVDATADQLIDSNDPSAFSGKFTVGMYYADDVKPTKLDIVVIKNHDQSNVKLLKADVTTYPTVLSVTGSQLQALFGGVVTGLGDSYTIGANITTKEGKVYPAFSDVADQNNVNIPSLAGSSPSITYGALCGFNMQDYGAVGDDVPYTVVTDGWKDYAPGDDINVHIIDDTHLSFEYPTANNTKPVIIAIDPATNKTSVVKQTIGDYGDGDTFSVVSVAGSTDNEVLPCQLTVGVRITFTAPSGNYGAYILKLKRK